eukprot:XP_011618870.1 PREDICTED: AP-5 complex subunit sigma-1 [Takifugu rubripes]
MVRCFLIHTICPVSNLGPGESRILYSRVFGPNEATFSAQHRGLSPEEKRLLQKEKVAVVASGEEALALQEADSGAMRLRAGEPFSEEMSALWLGVQSLAFTLVCEAHENLLLAEGTLRNLSRHCLEQLHMLGQGSEVLLKSDRVDALLGRVLPHGQLLFLNHRFAQGLEKEVAAYASK